MSLLLLDGAAEERARPPEFSALQNRSAWAAQASQKVEKEQNGANGADGRGGAVARHSTRADDAGAAGAHLRDRQRQADRETEQ